MRITSLMNTQGGAACLHACMSNVPVSASMTAFSVVGFVCPALRSHAARFLYFGSERRNNHTAVPLMKRWISTKNCLCRRCAIQSQFVFRLHIRSTVISLHAHLTKLRETSSKLPMT